MALNEVKTASPSPTTSSVRSHRRSSTARYPVGTNLPAERQLAEDFGVNRHVIREATKRAEQVGLVKATQGGGTDVLDFEKTAGLDALALLAEYAAEDLIGARLWRAGFEMRAAIGTDLARLCALRADQQDQGTTSSRSPTNSRPRRTAPRSSPSTSASGSACSTAPTTSPTASPTTA